MRTISYILVVVGILLLARAGYDEFSGSTRTPTSKYNPISETVTKNGNPDAFHNAMTYHWFYAFMLLGAGGIAYLIDKGHSDMPGEGGISRCLAPRNHVKGPQPHVAGCPQAL